MTELITRNPQQVVNDIPCTTCGATTNPYCRACGQPFAVPLICRGMVPLANALLAPGDTDPDMLPLHVAMCSACAAVQVAERLDPAEVFDRAYPYRSSVNEPMVRHARDLADTLTIDHALTMHDTVVEVGSNDGYLLRHYRDRRVRVIGIDPAEGAVAAANADDVWTIRAHFTAEYARAMVAEGVRAQVIHAHNVLAHIPDVVDALTGIAALLAPDGVAVVETPSLVDLVDGMAFDTVYHEHIYTWSLTAFLRTARRAGLTVWHVDHDPIHGGSLRMTLVPVGTGRPDQSVLDMLHMEARKGATTGEYLRRFAQRIDASVDAINTELRRLRGAKIAAFGAAAKGVMLLTALGATADTIRYVIDDTPAKQGMLLPGSRIPIVSRDHLDIDPPDVLLILPWNWEAQIRATLTEYRGRYLIPLPEPRLVAA